jgi:hypothetical protein
LANFPSFFSIWNALIREGPTGGFHRNNLSDDRVEKGPNKSLTCVQHTRESAEIRPILHNVHLTRSTRSRFFVDGEPSTAEVNNTRQRPSHHPSSCYTTPQVADLRRPLLLRRKRCAHVRVHPRPLDAPPRAFHGR